MIYYTFMSAYLATALFYAALSSTESEDSEMLLYPCGLECGRV